MVDLSKTIIAKSDQLNADDLMGGPLTVRIQDVREGNADQPIAIFYEGCNGKPYYPCKSMRRVLVNVWGKDGKAYAGKGMTLFREPSVKFGGIAVGGIRISHMTDITQDTPLALQVTRGSKKLYTVKPLRIQPEQREAPADRWAAWIDGRLAAVEKAATLQDLQNVTGTDNYKKAIASLTENGHPRLAGLQAAVTSKAEALNESDMPADDMVPA
ncbi:hypothetical protein HKD21_10230 [Gluconobacter cerevisiae]|uniref:Uncharacterized protein n=1 Tax=Gluconobacter cerevisiae TaxID=1379734 RepID=A0ABR9YFD1_9PROT|nr:hypothetical protein [Gluconobacter cerevisiae]MBF0877222.1 hypothetical protein [Gluconobacter cerevisiae]